MSKEKTVILLFCTFFLLGILMFSISYRLEIEPWSDEIYTENGMPMFVSVRPTHLEENSKFH